jgi:hypothetical protein
MLVAQLANQVLSDSAIDPACVPCTMVADDLHAGEHCRLQKLIANELLP